MAYPCFLKPFEIYTDASTLQSGAVITQENRPIVFFSQNSLTRNLNTPLPNQSSQPKEFHGMLWVAMDKCLHRP